MPNRQVDNSYAKLCEFLVETPRETQLLDQLSQRQVAQLKLLARFLEPHFTLGSISVNDEILEPEIVQTLRAIVEQGAYYA